MSHRLWRQPGMTHLDIRGGGSGGHKKEILFGALLGAVVIGTVLLILFHFVGGGQEVKPRLLHMICTSTSPDLTTPVCNYDFEMSESDLPFDRLTPAMGTRADCPKCKGQLTCVEALRCPSCMKYFAPPTDDSPIICPFCQTDVVKYVLQHR